MVTARGLEEDEIQEGWTMMKKRKVARRHRFPRLLAEYEENIRTRVQRGEIKEVTLDTYMNDANRVFEALVFAIERNDIEKAMKNYRYGE